MRLHIVLLFLLNMCFIQFSYAQLGKDGVGNIGIDTDVNPTKTNLTANATIGATSIQVTNGTGFLAGDLIMIYQAQGAEIKTTVDDETWGSITNMQNAGGYEFVEVAGVVGTTITLKTGLDKGYTFSRTINTVTFPDLVQIIKVPRYQALTVGTGATISPAPWNGKTGGVTVIEVNGDLTLNGTIDVTGKGFRGGAVEVGVGTNDQVGSFRSLVDRDGGLKGESVVGNKAEYTAYGGSYGRGAVGNGGGGGNGHNAAGGGGANAFDMVNTPWSGLGNPDPQYNQYWTVETSFGNAPARVGGISNHKSSGGGRGGYSWSNQDLDPIVGTSLPAWGQYGKDHRDNIGGYGGRPLNAAVGKAFLGGGGGAGSHDNDHTQPGGNGGGLVIILSNGKIIGNGQIKANGADGSNDIAGTNNSADAPSGAGGGGSVILKATFGVGGSIGITTNGGKGGSQMFPFAEAEGAAGGGGGGYVAQFNTATASGITIGSAGGATGITTTTQTQIRTKFPPNGATLGAEGSNAFFAVQPAIPVCSGQTATLTLPASVTALTGANVSWYDAITGGNKLPGSGSPWTSPALPAAVSDTFYYSTATNGIDTRFAIIVPVNPVPQMSAVNPPAVCSPATVDITPTPLVWKDSNVFTDGSGIITYWQDAATTVAMSPAAAASISNSGNYYIKKTTVQGCIDTAVVVAQVNPPINVVANPATICRGDTTTLTASGGASYSWGPAAGLSGTTGPSIKAFPAATSPYTVRGTDSNGCFKDITVTITVNPLPTVVATGAVICAGSTATISASGASTYTWTPSGGSGSSTSVQPTAPTIYTAIGVDANGCKGSDTAKVTINPLPVVVVSPAASICVGGSVDLTASGANTYSWAPSTALVPSTGPQVKASPLVNTTYTVIGTSLGCSNTASVTITVNAQPTVDVSPNVSICKGDSTTLTASLASTYSWSPALGLSSSQGAVVKASPDVTRTYTVTGTTNGCPGAPTKNVTVTVNDLPILSITPDIAICKGGSTSITVTGGLVSYLWTPAVGITNGSNNILVKPLVTTTYTVAATDANGCKNKDSSRVTINPLPTITATTASICSGNDTTLQVTGAFSYQWSPGAGLSSTTDSVVNAAPTLTTFYTIIGTDHNGCKDTTTTSLIVNNTPVVKVTNVSICIGEQTILSPRGAKSYSWTSSLGTSGVTTDSTINVNTGVTATYEVKGITNGCSDTVVATVNVNPLPVIIASNDTTICVGSMAPLWASGAISYVWSPATGLNTPNGASVQSQPLTSTPYTVTGTDANGCKSSEPVQVNVNQIPIITLSRDTTICKGNSVILQAGGTVTDWTWTGLTPVATSSSITVTPLIQSQYTVTGKDNIGCQSSKSVTVSLYPPLNPIAGPATAICKGEEVTVKVTAQGATSYLWSNGATSTSIAVQPGKTTLYSIKVSNGGCAATDTVEIKVKDETEARLYIPNAFTPNEDKLNDVFKVQSDEHVVTSFVGMIFNRWGELYYQWETIDGGWDGRYNGTLVQEDVYVYKINVKNECSKIISQRLGTVTVIR